MEYPIIFDPIQFAKSEITKIIKYSNTYLSGINSKEDVSRYEKICSDLSKRIIPESYPDAPRDWLMGERTLSHTSLTFRDVIIKLSGFAFISYDWVRPFAKWIGNRKCLEIMCGSGCLSKALRDCGVSIIATDNASWKLQSEWFSTPWTDIEKIDCIDAIEKYGKDVDITICSWPYMDDTAYMALLKMRDVNPCCKMVYIGEWEEGCTADEAFFQTLKEIDDPEFKKSIRNFKQAWGLHDYPYLID